MVLNLKRPLCRKVSDRLVVTVTERGLVLRRPGKKTRCLIPWDDLENEYLRDVRTYRDAFELPLPKRWLPEAGQWILARPGGAKVYRSRAVKILHGLGEELVVVRPAGFNSDVTVALSATRPMPTGFLGFA